MYSIDHKFATRVSFLLLDLKLVGNSGYFALKLRLVPAIIKNGQAKSSSLQP
jgi:hypothetical protein